MRRWRESWAATGFVFCKTACPRKHMSEKHGATGLLLPSREALLWAGGDLAFLISAARNAEQVGFDSVWVGDSLLARPRGEPLTLLAAAAGATSRVSLGTA